MDNGNFRSCRSPASPRAPLAKMKAQLALVLVALTLLVSALPVIPKKYPLYKQCDPRWGNNIMGTTTICQEGCAMSSVSMAVGGWNIPIDSQVSNPAVLNTWLQHNHGYVCLGNDCNNLVIGSPSNISIGNIRTIGEVGKPAADQIRQMIDEQTVVIAHVQNNHHFVLLVGYESGEEPANTFYVNDPYFNLDKYYYNNMTDLLVYVMQTPK